ncbi:MAG: hypothetical protein ACYCVB_00005 [Bacilli bacterium]
MAFIANGGFKDEPGNDGRDDVYDIVRQQRQADDTHPAFSLFSDLRKIPDPVRHMRVFRFNDDFAESGIFKKGLQGTCENRGLGQSLQATSWSGVVLFSIVQAV